MAKISYVKEGQYNKPVLIIDGDAVDSSNYGIDSNIFAIQWDGSKGEIEYCDDTPNKEITDISSYDFESKHATEKKAIADAEAQEEATRIANLTYADKRSSAYPIIADQLDDIYHNGIDGWKATIKAVKDKYPK